MWRAARRLAALPLLRAILELRPVEHVAATVIRSRLVDASARFVLRELLRKGGVFRYGLRSHDAVVFLRHGTGDVPTLDEVFLREDYALPASVGRRLQGRDSPARIVDLGSNIGLSVAWFLLTVRDARVTAVEPDRANLTLLRRLIDANGWADRVDVVEAAAATTDGEVAFQSGGIALSRVVAPNETEERVRAIDALPLLAAADLAKIDIEGGEWEILADDRFARGPAVVVLEYHPHVAPEADPHRAAGSLLERAGYATVPIWARDDGHGMVWAVRPAE